MTRIDLLSNPMTTAEDIIVGGASGVPERLAAGSEGDVLTIDSGAVAWAAPTGGGGIDASNVDYSVLASTATISSSNWAAVDTSLDLVLPAVAGDLIEVSITSRCDSGGGSTQSFHDVVSMVGGSAVNSIGNGGSAPSGSSGVGVLPWVTDHSPTIVRQAGSVFYVALSGDLSGGNITIRWLARRSSANVDVAGGSRIHAVNWGQ